MEGTHTVGTLAGRTVGRFTIPPHRIDSSAFPLTPALSLQGRGSKTAAPAPHPLRSQVPSPRAGCCVSGGVGYPRPGTAGDSCGAGECNQPALPPYPSGAAYQRMMDVPQVSPPPQPHRARMSLGRTRPARTASSSAIGMEAAEVLP